MVSHIRSNSHRQDGFLSEVVGLATLSFILPSVRQCCTSESKCHTCTIEIKRGLCEYPSSSYFTMDTRHSNKTFARDHNLTSIVHCTELLSSWKGSFQPSNRPRVSNFSSLLLVRTRAKSPTHMHCHSKQYPECLSGSHYP
jgi:hypothetical protein